MTAISEDVDSQELRNIHEIHLNSKRKMFFSRERPQNSNNSIESLNSNSTRSPLSNVGSKDYSSYYSSYRRDSSSSRFREDMTSIRDKPLLAKDSDVNVGFYDLPNQIHRKTERKGFEFTLMVVGRSGTGKSTLVNSMFSTNIYSDEFPGPSKRVSKTVTVDTTKVRLKEKNVNLLLTIVDTPGYQCALDNSNCWQPISDYIENRYEEYLNAETRLHRSSIQDNRVHCCLYFINPSGHSLEAIDIEFMQHLHDKVNIIPVIAKADSLTPEECLQFKKNVMNEISQNQIKIYEFPESDVEEENKLLKQLKSRIPFAVVGSNYIIENAGDRKRGRKYPWGVVEVENLEHNDFVALRSMLLKYYMFDLLDTTNNIHYENYRCRKLSGIGNERVGKPNRDSNKNPLAQMEEEKKEHEAKMKKMEHEMEQVFEMKVKEKMQKLKDSEADLQRRHEQMNATLQQKRQELDEKRQALEKERAAFELVSRDMEEIRRVNTLEANSKE
ncbi:septin-7-like protein [Leptotrombidium deliense]|uniref:Septin-7 n=1 Tax=Leptotrombidium deliense TaxID=299467 RepID=A0A443SBD6_9ACAR|nr:septin-7-like protein [Leptotrombidium deliense]